jgi:hypothetical protein
MRRLAISNLDAQNLLPTEEAKVEERSKPDCCSSAALRLSGQPRAYNHNEPNERGDNAGCDADQRPDQQDLFGENKQRLATDRRLVRVF